MSGDRDARNDVVRPWSKVAMIRRGVPAIRVYRTTRSKRPMFRLPHRTADGVPRTFLVRRRHGAWLRVYLPGRPNGSSGWVHRSAVRVQRNPYHVEVDLTLKRFEVFRRKRLIMAGRVGVGKRHTPTPAGRFFIVALLRTGQPRGVYGPYAYVLSAHSRVFQNFAGGHGEIGLHGTNFPRGLGHEVSHGCIRMSNAQIARLARVLPLGTPITVVR
jgi:hypothetical protein